MLNSTTLRYLYYIFLFHMNGIPFDSSWKPHMCDRVRNRAKQMHGHGAKEMENKTESHYHKLMFANVHTDELNLNCHVMENSLNIQWKIPRERQWREWHEDETNEKKVHCKSTFNYRTRSEIYILYLTAWNAEWREKNTNSSCWNGEKN